MEEKYMVNDILEGTKGSLKTYESAIVETENTNLRQAFQEIRNSCETFQYDLFRVANLKGYYTPASKATQAEIDQVKTEVQQ
ncbi:MAG: spore coat protein [Clostridia bacterium]|jgi:spore coat protein CotF|nr:spore coat protein [Clostridia bacterium]